MNRALMIGGLLVLVGASLIVWSARAITAITASQGWTQTQCTVTGVELRRGASHKHRSRRHLDVVYAYVANGQPRRGDQWSAAQSSRDTDADEGKQLLQTFAINTIHPCWYDPAEPNQAALTRATPGALYALPIVGTLLVIAGIWLAIKPRNAKR